VTVTNPGGASAVLAGGFTVNAAPTATSVWPDAFGQGATGLTTQVVGTGFVVGATAAFSGTGITVTSVTRDSATQLTVTFSVTPSAATGTRNLVVTNPDGGVATCGSCASVAVGPTVTSVNPASRGQGAANQSIVVTGTNFQTGFVASGLSFGAGVTVNSVVRNSATQLTANVSVAAGAATGARDVKVTNPNGGTATLTNGFTITASPTITSVSPNSEPRGAANQPVVINGSNFGVGATVAFSGTGITVSSVVRNSANQLTVTLSVTAAASLGARNVTVTNTDGGVVVLTGGLQITA
jgi:hypothetical protein